MIERFNEPPPPRPESSPTKEGLEQLRTLFEEAERIFEAEGREGAKPLLIELYSKLQELNKRDLSEPETVWVWNKDGDLTEAEFNELNLRRKKLSNAVGIMTASGQVRHNLNEI